MVSFQVCIRVDFRSYINLCIYFSGLYIFDWSFKLDPIIFHIALLIRSVRLLMLTDLKHKNIRIKILQRLVPNPRACDHELKKGHKPHTFSGLNRLELQIRPSHFPDYSFVRSARPANVDGYEA